MRIGIIDYGAGNIRSVYNVFYAAGADPELVSNPETVTRFDRLILPGVGASNAALINLRARSLDEALNEAVRRRGRPLMGICLGMQLLADRLTEGGENAGLGWISGTVAHMRGQTDARFLVPHMGWNRVVPAGGGLMATVKKESEFFFAHSYALYTTDVQAVAGVCSYGREFVCAVQFDTVFATQFHPEKSQRAGMALIEAFLNWNP